MQYKGFEFYASAVPEDMVGELVAEGRAPAGAQKVYVCEIYRAEDEGQKDVLKVFDLVVGKDIADDADETLVFAVMGYIDDHYGELMKEAFRSEINDGMAFDARVQEILNQIESGRITETANAILSFDFEDGQNVVCVDFCYDVAGGLPACDVTNLLTLPTTDENISFAQALLRGIAEGWKIPVYDWSVREKKVSDPMAETMKVYAELSKLQEREEYRVAAVMAELQDGERFEPLADEDAYVLASKFEEVRGSWFTAEVGYGEFLEALKELLECGVYETNAPEFSELSPEETLKLLLAADNQVFGTMVESAAVRNWYRYEPYGYKLPKEDLNAVEKAADAVRALVGNVGELIGSAAERVAPGQNEMEMEQDKSL